MRKFLAESFLALALVFSCSFPVHAQEDNTTCFVLDGGDDVTLPEYPQLRRKVQQGYNRPTDRFCTELIRIKSGLKVTLVDSLPIGNSKDGDCPAAAGHPAVCGDGYDLVIDAQSGRVTIDVSAVPGGACGIELTSGNIKMTGIDIQATAEQAANRTALCNKADGNDLSDVKVNGKSFNCGNGKVDTGETCDDGNTSEDDECDNQCKPIAQPSPEASPSPSPQPPVLNAPTGLVALNDPSSSGTALKVLLMWDHHEGEKKIGLHLSKDILSKLKPLPLDSMQMTQLSLKPGTYLKPDLSIDKIKPGTYLPIDPGIFLIPKDYTFDIERTVKTGDTCGTFASIGNVNGVYKTFQDPTVAAKTTYCYRVRATRGSEHTDWSNIAEVRTPDPVLVIPTELEATALSEDRIYVRWTHPLAAGAINFRLERGNASCTPASFVAIATAINEEEYNDTGLDPATTYCYRVAALSDDTPPEQSLYSNTDKATTLEVGASPYPTPEATPSPSPLATPLATPEATPQATPEATPEATPVVTPTDKDGDGVKNEDDNCPDQANADQKDLDGDGMGNPCDPDADGDGVLNKDELAKGTDPLDGDTDDDSVPDNSDNCPTLGNNDQRDGDGDGIGDACDTGGSTNNNVTSSGGCSLSMLYANPSARLIYLAGVALLGYAMMRKRAK